MKVSWGKVTFHPDKGKYSRLIVQTGDLNGFDKSFYEAWSFLTKSQALRLAHLLTRWAGKK